MTEPRSEGLRVGPLDAHHTALGAAFTDFAGWRMPVRYGSDLAEHRAVREAAGLFDISHMAEFVIEGPDAAAFLDYALSGRLTDLPVGRAAYSLVLAADGGVVDDVVVYRLDEAWFLVIANAGNRAPVAAALSERAAGFRVLVEDASDSFALLALQGPQAQRVLDAIGLTELERPLAEVPRYAATRGTFAGDQVLVARTGYTGEDGFELLVPEAAAGELWEALLRAGEPFGLLPAGLAARDTLRLEAGMPLYGHELGLGIRPAQAGLARFVALDKPSFVGRDGVRPRDDAPVLVGLMAEGRRAARAGYPVRSGEAVVGAVTSGILSPTLGVPLAMAFVAPSSSALGTALELDVRGTRLPATVTRLPFYRRKP
ncbi:MAG: glycine cleavage system aminomethyltransferase GcvT [Microbacterium sp.]|uniref:glycine cleavage system aminomethyltransferase GcvT n=1 Tax=Microbacterium sp. TaxID=51671 RepID=UPI0039E6F867